MKRNIGALVELAAEARAHIKEPHQSAILAPQCCVGTHDVGRIAQHGSRTRFPIAEHLAAHITRRHGHAAAVAQTFDLAGFTCAEEIEAAVTRRKPHRRIHRPTIAAEAAYRTVLRAFECVHNHVSDPVVQGRHANRAACQTGQRV